MRDDYKTDLKKTKQLKFQQLKANIVLMFNDNSVSYHTKTLFSLSLLAFNLDNKIKLLALITTRLMNQLNLILQFGFVLLICHDKAPIPLTS